MTLPRPGLRPLAAALLYAGLFNAAPAGAASIVVNSLADAHLAVLNGNGTCDLREAIANAVSDDQSGGTECTAGNGDDSIDLTGLSGTLTIAAGQPAFLISSPLGAVTLNGPGPAGLSLSGGNLVRVLDLANATVALSDLTITQGFDLMAGGGIRAAGGSLTLDNVVVDDNHVAMMGLSAGGGLHLYDNSLTMTRSTLSGNSADGRGGGLFFTTYVDSDPNGVGLSISDSVISGNTAGIDGGGLFLRDVETSAPSTITSSVIRDNTSQNGQGGGLHVEDTLTWPLYLRASTFSGNTAGTGGGGLYLRADNVVAPITVWLENSTVSGNTVTGSGGAGGAIGLFGDSGAVAPTLNLSLVNSTVSGNRATDGFGAGGVLAFYASILLQNSILADSTAGANSNADDLRRVMGTLTVQSSLVEHTSESLGPGNLTGVAPQLGALGDNGGPVVGAAGATAALETRLPLPGSPVRDAGDNGLIPGYGTDDQRGPGFPRILGTAVDLGAVEATPAARPAGTARPVPGLAGWSLPALAGLLAWLGWGGGTRRSAGVQAGKRPARRSPF